MCWLKGTPQRPGRVEEAARGRKKPSIACFDLFWSCTGTASSVASVAQREPSPAPAQQHHRAASKVLARNHCGLGSILCLSGGWSESQLFRSGQCSPSTGLLRWWRRDRLTLTPSSCTGGPGEAPSLGEGTDAKMQGGVASVVCQIEFGFPRVCLPLVKIPIVSAVLKSYSVLSPMD